MIDKDGNYQQGIHAVVEIGEITIQNAEYDDEDNVITEPIYADGYHYDIMSERNEDEVKITKKDGICIQYLYIYNKVL